MTVIISMKFSPEFIMSISDERVSYMDDSGGERYDMIDKIYELGDSLVGMAGNLSFANSVFETAGINGSLDEKMTSKECAYSIAEVIPEIVNEYRQFEIGNDIGINMSDVYKTGLDIKPEILKKVLEESDNLDKRIYTEFLVSGIDNMSRIYYVPFLGKPAPRIYFEAIGTGGEIARKKLGRYFESLPLSKRDKIKPADGCKVMMEAFRAYNVGGNANIYWKDKKSDEKTNHLPTQESNLLQKTLEIEESGIIDNIVSQRVFDEIMEGADIDYVQRVLENKISKSTMFSHFFKGSRH